VTAEKEVVNGGVDVAGCTFLLECKVSLAVSYNFLELSININKICKSIMKMKKYNVLSLCFFIPHCGSMKLKLLKTTAEIKSKYQIFFFLNENQNS